MALNVKIFPRVFKHKEQMLPDPNPDLSPEEVMAYYSNQYPELTTSNVFGPKIENDTALYEFKTTVGTKG
jgi:PRTRC genetic system protein C